MRALSLALSCIAAGFRVRESPVAPRSRIPVAGVRLGFGVYLLAVEMLEVRNEYGVSSRSSAVLLVVMSALIRAEALDNGAARLPPLGCARAVSRRAVAVALSIP
jgi:hypothetical protein